MAIAQTKFALGLPSAKGESRFWERATDSSHACVLFAVRGANARQASRWIDRYFNNIKEIDGQILYEALSTIQVRVEAMECEISLAAVYIQDESLFLATVAAGIFLIRGTKRGELLTPKPELQVIQGRFLPGDLVVAYSQTIAGQLPMLLGRRLEFDHLQSFAQEVQAVIRRMNGSATMAAAFITGIVEEKLPETAPLVVPPKKSNPVLSLLGKILTLAISLLRWFVTTAIRLIKRLLQNRQSKATSSSLDSAAAQRTTTVPLWKAVLHPRKTFVGVNFSRKHVIAIALLILATLIITISIVVARSRGGESTKEYLTQLAPYQQTLADLTVQAETEPAQAYLGIQSLVQELTTLESATAENKTAHQQVLETLQQAQALAQKVVAAQEVEQLPVYDDLRKISPTFIASSMVESGGIVYSLDQQQQYLITYNISARNGAELALDSGSQLRALAGGENSGLALGDGIFLITYDGAQGQLTRLAEGDDALKASTLIGGYQDFVYVLNSEGRNITRYQRSGNSLSSKTTWIGSSSGVPFGETTNMVVDGDIWLGTKTGQIVRMRSGKTVTFAPTDLTEAFDSPVYLATSTDSDFLYVLEPKRERVIVLKKDTGEMINQIQNRTLGSATGLLYSETQQLVLAVSGSILYQIPL